MKIYNLLPNNTLSQKQQKPLIITYKKRSASPAYVQDSLCLLANYKRSNINFCADLKVDKKNINKSRLLELGIPNLHIIGNSLRGESLSSKKNRKFLIPIKKCGIEKVIDLRDKYTSETYEDMCKQIGLRYYHIPIDSNSVDDNEIIAALPTLFSLLNQEKVYIACAQGLHRTDIALALNYVFNPAESSEPPIMYGHFRDFGLKFDDIATRLNSIENKISNDDIKKFGWNSEEEFRQAFAERKKNLKIYNESLADNFINAVHSN